MPKIFMKKLFSSILIIITLSFINSAKGNDMQPDFSNLDILFSEDQISDKISQIAQVIDADYSGKEIVIVMIMKGSICFVADFIREIKTPFSLEYISCSSYGKKGSTRGELSISGLDKLDISSKHVLLVDDIFDSGATLSKVQEKLRDINPASLKSLVLLIKNTPNRIRDLPLPEYVVFEVEDKFVIGYGTDYNEYFRGLKNIYAVHE